MRVHVPSKHTEQIVKIALGQSPMLYRNMLYCEMLYSNMFYSQTVYRHCRCVVIIGL